MTRHVIDELVFDIAIDSGGHALRDESYLGRLVRTAMLPVLEDVLDACDDDDTVLVLPVLELDLGVFKHAEYEHSAPQRLRAALDDALRRAVAEARANGHAGPHAGAGAREASPGAAIVGRDDAELDRFVRFLDGGTLPWHAGADGSRAHEALLERLLARPGAALWAALARQLGDPRRARRLAEQFPVRQRRAVLLGMAATGTAWFDGPRIDGLGEIDAGPAAWAAALVDCARAYLGSGGLIGAAPPAGRSYRVRLQHLARFLETGALPQDAVVEAIGQPAHTVLLDALLDDVSEHGGEALWQVLARALERDAGASRLLSQFPQRQLIALCRHSAPQHASAFERLLQRLQAASPGSAAQIGDERGMRRWWRHVLAACVARPAAPLSPAPIAARMALELAGSAGLAGPDGAVAFRRAMQREDARSLWRTRSSERNAALALMRLANRLATAWGLNGDERLAASALAGSGATGLVLRDRERMARALLGVCSALEAALQSEAGRRFAAARSAGADDVPMLRAAIAARLSGNAAITPARRQALLDAIGAAARDAADPVHLLRSAADALAAGAPLDLEAMLAAAAASKVVTASADAAHTAAHGLAAQFTRGDIPAAVEQCRMLLREHATLARDAVRHYGRGPAVRRALARALPDALLNELTGLVDQAASAGAGDAAALGLERAALLPQPTLGLQPARAARSLPASPDRAPSEQGRVEAAATPSRAMRLQQMARYLDSGVLLPDERLESGAQAAHEALLDGLLDTLPDHPLDGAGDALWRVLARALERDDSASRLLAQFPQRQLIAVCRASAPDHAAALLRALGGLQAATASALDADVDRRVRLWWRHVLSACVARPSRPVLPAQVGARVALALAPDGRAPLAATRVYTRSAREEAYAMPWRPSSDELRAGRAWVRLATLAAPAMAACATGADALGGAAPAIVAASAPPLARLFRGRRAAMARTLIDACAALETALLRAQSRGSPVDDVATLRAAIAVQAAANPAIAARNRQTLLDAVDTAARGAQEPVRFLRAIADGLAAGAPLDLEALLAQSAAAAASASAADAMERLPAAPIESLAAAMQRGDGAAILAHCRTLLRDHAPQIRQGLRRYGRNPALRQALAQAIPDALLVDLASLQDAAAPALLRAVLTPTDALLAAIGGRGAWGTWTAQCRLQVLAALAGSASTGGRIDAVAFLDALVPQNDARRAALLAALPGAGPTAPSAAQATAQPTAQPAARGPAPASASAQQPPAPAAPMPPDTTELLVVGNAGMVLAAPYLPRLFGALGLMADGAFVDDAAAGRAVHLVQVMVTGRSHTPEYELVLNKILCGVPIAAPVPAGIDVTRAELDTVESLVQAMVAHAKAFGSCSVDAMRQTFLARSADLRLVDDAWQLRVHPGPFDMLLDRLPWSYSIVKFGWMARPVHVEWRPT